MVETAPSLSGPLLQARQEPADSLVVLLHGYGSDGHDLIALGQHWQPLLGRTIFVAPHAPTPCALSPSGFEWFALDLDRDLSRLVGAEAARPTIEAFLEALWDQTGIGPERTVLAGFSQGAMMALDVGLRRPDALAGILAFSGMVIDPDRLAGEIASRPPVALFHGDADEVVPMTGSIAGESFLKTQGVDVTLHVTKGSPHTIAPDALALAGQFLQRVIGDAP